MTVLVTTDAAQVAALADAAAARDGVANTAFGTIAWAVGEADAAPWAAYPDGRPEVLAARSHARSPLSLTGGWTDARELTDAIRELDPAAPGVAGAPETVEAIVAALGRPATDRMDERLFRLDELTMPAAVAGSARLSDDADEGWLAEWFTAFAVEAFGRLPPGFDASKMLERSRGRSRCWIWVDDTGVPVSFAVRHPAVCGVSRIGPVYTPSQHRCRGYGSAVTATASRDILDVGEVACLLTDLANPTSNHIYTELGYRAVLDRTLVRFD